MVFKQQDLREAGGGNLWSFPTMRSTHLIKKKYPALWYPSLQWAQKVMRKTLDWYSWKSRDNHVFTWAGTLEKIQSQLFHDHVSAEVTCELVMSSTRHECLTSRKQWTHYFHIKMKEGESKTPKNSIWSLKKNVAGVGLPGSIWDAGFQVRD